MEEKQTTGAMPASDMSGTSPTVSPMPNAVSSTVPASPPVSSQPGFAQPVVAMGNAPITPPKKNGFLSLKPLLFTGIMVAGMGLAGVFAFMRPAPTSNDALSQQASSFAIQDVDLSDLATSGSLDLVTNQSLSVNGQLRTNNSLVITPTDTPLTGTAGQLYFDKSAAKFGYYDGTKFTLLAGSNELDGLRSQLQSIDTRVTAIPPAQSIPTDIATLGANNVFSSLNTFSSGLSTSSLAVTGNGVLQGSLDVSGSTTLGATTISNLLLTSSLGVTSGGTGTSSLTANGVVIANGTGPLTTATYASGGQCLMSPASGSGAPVFGICPGGVGYGVNSLNGLMGDLVIANATASGATVTINDASGVSKGIASFNASNLTVTSGVVNTVQNISSTATPTFAGLTLTADLSVTNGGTGASNFTANGIVIGNGTSALGTITPGSVGQCLIATAGAPTFQTCPSTPIPPNVSSLNGLTGALVLNNSVGSGSSITINDASTAAKGIASFNSTNFSVSGGAVNTIQSINTLATPTFAGINTGSLASASTLSVSAAVNNNLTLATSGTGALYLSGYDCSASGNGGKLTVDATGRVNCGADGDTDTVGITEIVAGPGIAVSGNQVSVRLQTGYGLAFDAVSPNGLGIQACANTEILKSNGSGWVCSADNNTPGDGTGITAIGALDGGTLSADGASIGGAGTTLYLQSASNINPGLVNATTQTFGGAKTFNAAALFAGGLTVSAGQNIILGTTCAAGEVLTTNLSGVVTCVVDNQGVDTNTTYTAGNGLTLSVANEFSANIRTNYGLQADGNGIALTGTCLTGEILKRTAGGWACAVDTNTTYTAGDGLTLTGTTFSTSIRSGFGLQADSNGLAMLESCVTNEILKRTAGGWACASDAVGTGDGVGVTTVGTIDSQTKSGDGAVIIGSTIYLQNADSTSIGLVSAGAQTFGGAKTFNASALFNTGLSIAAGQSLTLGGACGAGQVLSTNVGGTVTCVTDANTTYTAGTGLTLTGTQFSSKIYAGYGIQADGNGIALIDTCLTGEILKRTAGGWACAVDGGDGVGVTVSGAYTDGSLTKFNATGQIMNSSLSEGGTTLTYGGNAVINAASGFTGNLLDVKFNGTTKFSVSHTGVGTFTGLLGAYGGIDTNNQNISAGNGSITGALNSTAAILLNGNDINLGGTLTNVAYKDVTNTFTQANTFSASVITPLLQSASATALTLTGNAASMWSTTAGNLTIQAGSGTVSLGNSTSLISSSNLTVTSGGSLNLSSSGVNVANFDSGTTGAVNIGANANAKAITVGNSTGTTSLTLQGGTGGVSIGTSGVANTIQIGNTTGAVAQTINIGTNATASSTGTVTIGNLLGTSATTIQGGTGASALTLTSGAGGTISIGTTNTNTVTIGRAAGTVTLQGTVNAASGLYTGGTAGGNLRVSNTGALSNVSIGTVSGAVVAAPTTGALSVATTASTGLCLLSNGSGSAPSFQTCPAGSGSGWSLTGNAGTTVGTNFIGTTDNQAVMIKSNSGAPTPSYIQINSSSNDSIGAITIAGNGPAGSSGGGTNWFDVKQAGGATFFGISGSGTNARVQMYLQPGSNIGVQSRVCSTNAVGAAGLATMGVCTNTGTDLAESYNSTQTLEVGEIVAVDPDNYPNVLRSSTAQQSNLMGIVSTDPDYVMGEGKTPNGYPIALNGRVPTKVNGEGGPIQPGDKITSSSVPGVGKKATASGMIVGTALTGFNGSGQGVIEVFVHLDYYAPSSQELLQANEARFGTLNVSGAANIDSLVVRDVTITGGLTVTGLATVQSINVKGHIITSSGQPTAQTMNANLGGAVEVDGTDTTGTITITTGVTVSAGELAKIIFSELYGKAPRVMLTPSNDAAGGLDYFKGITTTESFILNGKSLPSPNTTYKFDYFIAE